MNETRKARDKEAEKDNGGEKGYPRDNDRQRETRETRKIQVARDTRETGETRETREG